MVDRPDDEGDILDGCGGAAGGVIARAQRQCRHSPQEPRRSG
jgi:hypothetical protein